MKFDLKDFKKVQENDKGITLEHKKGHKISVAKNGISQNLKSQFAAMPLYQADPVDEVKNPSEGNVLDKISSFFTESSPAPQQSNNIVDPETQAKHNLYNEAVTNVYGQDPEITRQIFGGTGALFEGDVPPTRFNPAAAEYASRTYDQEKAAAQARQKESQKQSYDDMLRENQARLSMGMTPQPLPPPPQMDQPIKPASFDGAPEEPQAPMAQSPTQLAQSDFDKYMKQYQQGYQQQIGGIEQQAKAEEAQGSAMQKAAQEQIQQAQELQKHQQDAYNELNQERLGLVNDVKNGKINPQHYVENMSVPGKVSTAIGILLSGVGVGLGGGENMAMKFLNDQIDRDINAQKSNLASKENLLSANLRQFGNMHDAVTMTRIMQNDIYSAKIQEEAAKAQGPLAQAKAQQMIGNLQQQNAQMMQNMSLRLGAMKSLQGGMGAAQDPEQKLRMLGMAGIIPETEKQKLMGDLKEAQDTVAFKDNVLSAFQQLSGLDKLGNRVSSPIQSASQIAAIKGPLTAALSKGTAGRFTEQDAALLDKNWPTWKDDDQTRRIKLNAINKLVSEKMHFPSLTQYGIDPTKQGRFSQSGESRFKLGAPVKPK